MRRIQFSLTVSEGKWLIAHAIADMKEVRDAIAGGRIVLKGGTTVSCVSELITGTPLRICGRISKRGAVSSKFTDSAQHSIMYSNGEITGLDPDFDTALLQLGPNDVIIIGANIIDNFGGAAMLAGSPAGNNCGRGVSAMSVEGGKTIIAAGMEKLIPGSVWDSIRAAQRKGVDASRGMACGLFPVVGELVTELSAIKLIADVEATLIGRGGIDGAEGGCLCEAEVAKLEAVLEKCYGRQTSGEEKSMVECSFPCAQCGRHLSCCYKAKGAKRC